jgi:hypothetical protein
MDAAFAFILTPVGGRAFALFATVSQRARVSRGCSRACRSPI